MMFFGKLVYFTLLHLVANQLQINLDQTDVVSPSDALQHDCLQVATRLITRFKHYQIISYCMSESPSKWNIKINPYDQSFTFAELAKRNITSQQLYHWSAPMNIIEDYQFYLDQSSISSQIFYNCTLPNFGPFCQYSLDIPMSKNTTINDIIDHFYEQMYEPMTMTCYIHLPCNRGSTFSCLDWAEICDGKIDCLNDGIDEQHCWQLEINECAENEYRCNDGQCVEETYVNEAFEDFECIDQSDQKRPLSRHYILFASGPTFLYEDIRCPDRVYSEITFTSSCVYQRHHLLFEAMFLNKPDPISDECWFTFRCYFKIPDSLHPKCREIYENETSKQIINESCPDIFYIPNVPVLFGHIYLAYTKKAALESTNRTLPPSYICYDHRLCDGFSPNKTLLLLNNRTCRRPEDFPIAFSKFKGDSWMDMYLKPIFKQLYKCKTTIYNNSIVCSSSIMYQCANSSKCISKYRIGDGLLDCDYGDDEEQKVIYDICLKFQPRTLFQCTATPKCIHYYKIENGDCDCGCDESNYCDDELIELNQKRRRVSFPEICNGFHELVPFMVDGRNETDEMECEFWQCNNTYTRCNDNWNCLNGADEVDCKPSELQCPLHHHTCISIETNKPICLPIEKANDGKIDCLEGADEPKHCQANENSYIEGNIDCQNYTSLHSIKCSQLCLFNPRCYHADIGQYCSKLPNFTRYDSICNKNGRRKRLAYEYQLTTVQFPMNDNQNSEIKIPFSSLANDVIKDQHRCHRGIPLRVWIDREKNRTATTCLCPPSFYGDTCQYQNERVSLTLKLKVHSDSLQTVFAIVVSLIDDSNERTIHSYDQFSHLYIRDCEEKFKIYLLYFTRPKNQTKNYFIHIDVYEKISLTYRASFLLLLKFPFLPVQRLAAHLTIPHTNENIRKCTNLLCIHGQCRRYSEDRKDMMFCHCNQGWSGQYCDILHTCTCSLDSLCVGITASNRSICVCPLDKFGSRCFLRHTICQSNQNDTCFNDGQCVSADEHTPSDQKFFCICPKGFTGYRCEWPDKKIIVSFHKDMQLSRSMIVHFVQTPRDDIPAIGSTSQTISIYQKVVTLYWSNQFDLVLMQIFDKDLYMFVNPHKYNMSAILEVAINSSDRCKYINEVLNETIVNLHLIRRIKYYHVPCQSPFLPCFYDNDYFCMCNNFGHHRLADCYEFDSRKKLDCFGNNYCENDAQCLQDKSHCPTTSVCICSNCFYGTRCQFSSSIFGLSLDAILGYHIQPHISLNQQPSIVQCSLALTILMTFAGLSNGILSLLTFKNTEPQDVGCDLYLFGSSITILFTMIMFALKFWILIGAQITYSMNRTFLSFQCISFDYLLRIGLNMDQWLNACVAIERAVTIIKGIRFNKKKSKQIARCTILSLLFLTMITTIHDPIYRKLIYDGNDYEEKRIWCVVTYSSSVQIYNSIINIFRFTVPFGINIFSAIIIIKTTTRLRNRIAPQQGYQQILQIQIRRHSRILIAPVVLIIFTTPRLILSLVSGCMKSIDDAWIFLIGYYISFLPLILTFLVFVLPSKTYKKKFRKTIRQFQIILQTRLHLNINW